MLKTVVVHPICSVKRSENETDNKCVGFIEKGEETLYYLFYSN